MARNVYSFVKIRKKETRKGIIYSGVSIGCMVILLVLIGYAFYKGGDVPGWIGAVGYLGLFVSLFVLKCSVELQKDNEAYGSWMLSSLYFSGISSILYGLVAIIGLLIAII